MSGPLLPQAIRFDPLRAAPGRAPDGLAAEATRLDAHRAALGPAGDPATLIDRVAAAGLTGCGGGHFPVDRKWATALRAGGGGLVVANLAEGEPASAKDAALAQTAPHLILDGLDAVARAIGAERTVLWLHDDATHTRLALGRALAERAGTRTGAPWPEIAVAPHGYLSGESSAVVRALSGGPALPQTKRSPRGRRRGGRPADPRAQRRDPGPRRARRPRPRSRRRAGDGHHRRRPRRAAGRPRRERGRRDPPRPARGAGAARRLGGRLRRPLGRLGIARGPAVRARRPRRGRGLARRRDPDPGRPGRLRPAPHRGDRSTTSPPARPGSADRASSASPSSPRRCSGWPNVDRPAPTSSASTGSAPWCAAAGRATTPTGRPSSSRPPSRCSPPTSPATGGGSAWRTPPRGPGSDGRIGLHAGVAP